MNNLYNTKVYSNKGNIDVLNQVPVNAKRILDIGCGAGDNAKILKSHGKYVVGITISEVEAMFAKKNCDEVIIQDIEHSNINFEEKFDCILMSHICEHLTNPELIIEKFSLFLNPKGVLIIAVPNMAFYKLRFRILRGDWSMTETGPFDRTHLHFYSFYSVDSLVKNTTLRIVNKISGNPSFPLYFFRRISNKFSNYLDIKFGKWFPNLFSIQIVIVLQKGE